MGESMRKNCLEQRLLLQVLCATMLLLCLFDDARSAVESRPATFNPNNWPTMKSVYGISFGVNMCATADGTILLDGNSFAYQHVNIGTPPHDYFVGTGSNFCWVSGYPVGYVYGRQLYLSCPAANPPYTYNPSHGMCERTVTDACTLPHASGSPCVCDAGYEWDEGHTQCVPQKTYTLTLQSNKPNIEPSGTTAGDDNSSATFTVTVIDQTTQQGPTKPVQVKLIAHKPTEGGHDHDDPSRPRGGLNGTECTTDEHCVTLTFDGGIATQTVNYKAPIVSGKHSFSATCEKCGNSPQTANLEVKVEVEGLKEIPDFPFYSLLESNGAVVGARTGWHTNNHNLTPAAAGVLMRIASNYYFHPKFLLRVPVTNTVSFPPLFHLNDASLPLGGVYDYCARPTACERGIILWKAPHRGHRRGTVIDVRANDLDGAIPLVNRMKFENYLVERGVPYLREDQGKSNEHFHLMLMGTQE